MENEEQDKKQNMSLMSLDQLSMIVDDLNKEINYKISEQPGIVIPEGTRFLMIFSDGEEHRIEFLGDFIFDSLLEKVYEKIPPDVEIKLNERPEFEAHLRQLIMDKINMIKNLQV